MCVEMIVKMGWGILFCYMGKLLGLADPAEEVRSWLVCKRIIVGASRSLS